MQLLQYLLKKVLINSCSFCFICLTEFSLSMVDVNGNIQTEQLGHHEELSCLFSVLSAV